MLSGLLLLEFLIDFSDHFHETVLRFLELLQLFVLLLQSGLQLIDCAFFFAVGFLQLNRFNNVQEAFLGNFGLD